MMSWTPAVSLAESTFPPLATPTTYALLVHPGVYFGSTQEKEEEKRDILIGFLRNSIQSVISSIILRLDMPSAVKEHIATNVEQILFCGLLDGKQFYGFLEAIVLQNEALDMTEADVRGQWLLGVKSFKRHAGISKPTGSNEDTRGRAWVRHMMNSKVFSDETFDWLLTGPTSEFYEEASIMRSTACHSLLKSLLLGLKFIDFRISIAPKKPLAQLDQPAPNPLKTIKKQHEQQQADNNLAAILGSPQLEDLDLFEAFAADPPLLSNPNPDDPAEPQEDVVEEAKPKKAKKKVKAKIIDL